MSELIYSSAVQEGPLSLHSHQHIMWFFFHNWHFSWNDMTSHCGPVWNFHGNWWWLLFWFIFFLLLSCFSVFIFQLLTSYEMNSMYLPFPPLQGVFSLWRLSHLSWTESSFHVSAFTIAAQLLGSYPKPHYPAQSQASVLYSLSVIEFVVCAVIIVALVLQASDLVFTKGWTCTLFSFTAEKYSILYMYRVFIIFSELKDIYVVSIY